MAHFRFMDLDIWKESIALNDQLFDVADTLTDAKSFRVAEQLRGASLSIPNNIAEGSGAASSMDFAYFLNIAHRSVFEVANILIVISRKHFITEDQLSNYLFNLELLSKRKSSFRKSILNNNK
jgi:four helix bundle protein